MPCAMTSMSATVLMSETKPCRTTAWSSITIIRILSLMFVQRHINRDLCSAFVRAVDLHHSANLLSTLPHPNQAKVTVGDLCFRIETAAVVANTELHASCVEVQRNINAICARVLDCIVDCFLSDTQEICLNRKWQRTRRTRHLDDSFDVVLRREAFGRVA